MTTASLRRVLLVVTALLSLALAPAGAWAQSPPDDPSPAASDPAVERLLGYGSIGPAVERWQERFNAWVDQTEAARDPLTVDGIFGARTLAATIAFQRAQGIAADGVVGPVTRGAMDEQQGDGELSADEVLSDAIDTSEDTGEGSGPAVAVTDVRVGSHDGFDRVTFDVGGEGQAGWQVGYVDEARAQGSGNPIDVAGDAVLSVSLRNMAYPVEPPAGVQPWDGPERIAADSSGPVAEVVEDTVFEGHHVFFVGVTGEQPFQVRRFEEPQRVVVDIAASGAGATDPAGDLPGGDLVRCESSAGFAVSHPASWSAQEGAAGETCTLFNPEPVEVPVGTDERVAAITAYVDPVPFHEVAAPDPQRDAERAATAIDGLQAVRLEFEADEGLWPQGTPVTLYAVDLTPGADQDPETLFLDTVGLSTFDYERNQVVLDRMARTLEITREDVATDPGVVARYEGGGGAFSVEGDVSGDQACLRIPPEGEEVCTAVPGPGELRTVQLDDLGPVLAGVTGADVFRVTAERSDGSTSTVLTAPAGSSDVRGFAFAFGPDSVERLRTFDVTGTELGTVEPG